MIVKPCPKCGRLPIIEECVQIKRDVRRRMCGCKNLCSVVPRGLYTQHYFVFLGDGDDNAIFAVWNKCIDRYLSNSKDCSVIDKRIDTSPYI